MFTTTSNVQRFDCPALSERSPAELYAKQSGGGVFFDPDKATQKIRN